MAVIDCSASLNSVPCWPCAETPPLTTAVLRATPEDFLVEEQIPYTLSGTGEHLWVKVRKRGLNTEQVAKQLARLAGITRREVGYAGMKDRNAVTVQWFSLYLPGRADPEWGEIPEGMIILESVRHTRKLKTGALSGNRFVIVLRDCQGDRDAVLRRVEDASAHGVPNYFGEQRFGHAGGNVAAAHAMFSGKLTVRDRKQAGIYLSAARSFLFNQVLARRVVAANWAQALEGDALNLNGSRSFFVPETIDDTIRRRIGEGDVHPSGPLWGRGELATRMAVRALETEVISEHADLAQGLEGAGLEQERRALRLFPREFRAEWLEAQSLRLEFSLPPGSYATVLLREIAVLSNINPSHGEDSA